MEAFKLFLMLVGAAVTIYFAVFLLVAIGNIIIEAIGRLLWTRKYKHRFDKPPKAKCYCKDCKYRVKKSDISVQCTAHDRFWPVSDFFCADAEPKEKEDE